MRTSSNRRRPRPPLDPGSLEELALAYVGRFATSRAKLRQYLQRKVRDRGWSDAREPPIDALAERFAAQGYVDDAGYALSKARGLTGRGYGARRVDQSLRAAGIDEADGEAARKLAIEESVDAALRFARRKRIGPFAPAVPEPRERERALAAMMRAGHGFALSRAIVDASDPERAEDEDFLDALRNITG